MGRRSAAILLFVGPPGTGKTMAAKRLAEGLRMDLHRIDLSRIVDKYIGETARRQDRALAVIDLSGAIALFDLAELRLG